MAQRALGLQADSSAGADPLAILRSLRKARDERQLTQIVGSLAQADEGFRVGLLRVLVEHARYRKGMLERFDPHQKTTCRVEQPLVSQGELLGYVDLVLAQPGLALFVEVKLHSDYGPQQLFRYLRGIDGGAGELLVSVTRNVSRYREPPEAEPAWLGSLRWARLEPALRDLPTDGPLRQQWNLLLDVLKEDGDMGSTNLSPEHVIAYERSDDAYSRLTDFLEQIGIGALQRLRAELGGGDAEAASLARFSPARRRRKAPQGRRSQELDEDQALVLFPGVG